MLDKITLFLLTHAHAADPIDQQFEAAEGKNYYFKLSPLAPGDKTLGDFVVTIIDIILWIAGIAAVIYLLWAGILYITSAGDEARAEKGRKGIVNAVIGIIIITLAFVIEKVAAELFKGA